MMQDPPDREYTSPVIYWSSEWENGVLVRTEINKESRAYKMAYNARCARKINERQRSR